MPEQLRRVIGPGAYSSPDPATQAGALVPIDVHPLKDSISPDYGGGVQIAPIVDDTKAAPVKAEIEVPADRGAWTKPMWKKAADDLGLVIPKKAKSAEIQKAVEDHEAWLAELNDAAADELDEIAADYDLDPEDFEDQDALKAAIVNSKINTP